MAEALSIMFWPLIACLLLPGILVYYGLHIVRREIIFVDLALAQVAALGICLSILLKHDAGDWLIPCPRCGAKNILSPIPSSIPTWEITGWRE